MTPARARNALRAVIDPEIYQNIVDLGLVYNVEVLAEAESGSDSDDDGDGDSDDDGNGQAKPRVVVTMTLTTPHCPLGPQIIQDVEQTLLREGAGAVEVAIVWQPPWTPDAMTDELKRTLGLLDDEDAANGVGSMVEMEEEMAVAPEPVLELPPPLPKRSWLSRLFGR